MKKVLLTKTTSAVPRVKITSPDMSASKIAYRELFQALINIPDKEMVQRVMDAINGTTTTARFVQALCPNCKCSFGSAPTPTVLRAEASTQTESDKEQSKHANNNKNEMKNSDESQPPLNMKDVGESLDEPPQEPQAPVRRKRKRKVCLPQVVKRSHAQYAQSQLQPKMKKRKAEVQSNGNGITSSPVPSTGSNNEMDILINMLNDSDHFLELELELTQPKAHGDYVVETMAKEMLESDKFIDGLMPIHRATVDSDHKKLQRQIYVWKNMRKQDLNTLLTDEDEDCLQLAVVNDCFPKIIEILLDAGLNANITDHQSNTCIHLAVLNEIDLDSLQTLMKHIDLSILLKLNDDGYTPLQLAVRYDYFRHAEVLLSSLDERLLGKALYVRPSLSEKATRADFMQFYESTCNQLHVKFNNSTSRLAQPKIKKKLLKAGDMKSGNTALFFAIENKFEHLVYFLLAHLSDPRVENHCGQDAKSYYNEFGRALGLSLKVDNAMERVIQLLQ